MRKTPVYDTLMKVVMDNPGKTPGPECYENDPPFREPKPQRTVYDRANAEAAAARADVKRIKQAIQTNSVPLKR